MLQNSRKIFDMTKRDVFQIIFFQIYRKHVNTLTREAHSKTRGFRHWSNYISRSQQIPKYLCYEADRFFPNAQDFAQIPKMQ